jgi:uncharacterized membrane-anchored protein
MIRSIFFLVLVTVLSSLLYFFFRDVGDIEIFFSDYYVVIPAGVFCIILFLSVLLISWIIGAFWWLKNLPKNLVRLRTESNYQKFVTEIFDIICALESDNKDLAIKLHQKSSLSLIKHPIANLISWRVACIDSRCNESDIEKILLLMKEDVKTFVPAVKELIINKLKASDFETAGQYLALLEKLSYKPKWFYRVKINVSIGNQKWDGAIDALEKLTKQRLIDDLEAKSLLSLIYYLKAKSYLSQNLNEDAISILKKSFSSNNAHVETALLLADLLQTKAKDAIAVISKCWEVMPDYKLLEKMSFIYHDLPAIKQFEELEKFASLNKSDEAYLIIARFALELNLLDKAHKYLVLCKKNNNDSYRKLSSFYKLLLREDRDVALDCLKEFLGE